MTIENGNGKARLNGDSIISAVTGSSSSPLVIQEDVEGRSITTSDGGGGGDDGNHGAYHGFKQEEVTKVLIQALYDLGYGDVAKELESESGLRIESEDFIHLRQAVLNGQWDEAEDLLQRLQLNPNTNLRTIKFFIRRQEFIERLSENDKEGALVVLRMKLASLDCNKDELHGLSKMVLYSEAQIREELDLDSVTVEQYRTELVKDLQGFMSPAEVLPPRRLSHLLEYAKEMQLLKSNYYIGDEQFSLYKDFKCGRSHFPTRTTQVLTEHTDEVWYIDFSHNGKYLASASKDKTVKIWDTSDWNLYASLEGHERGIEFIAWSPDDTKLISCGEDQKAIVWNVESKEALIKISEHQANVSSAAWLTNTEFLTAAPDLKVIHWNVDGTELYRWTTIRVLSMAATADRKYLICLDTDKNVNFIDLATRSVFKTVKMSDTGTDVTVSRDSKSALVNVKPDEIHLWNLETMRIEHKYVGHVQKEFIVHSCFGGPHENFILSGSFDGLVYIWNRYNTMLLETLPGHTSNVSCVRWSPTVPRMFASASDDKTIRIWGP